jgi:hypothetical protein
MQFENQNNQNLIPALRTHATMVALSLKLLGLPTGGLDGATKN